MAGTCPASGGRALGRRRATGTKAWTAEQRRQRGATGSELLLQRGCFVLKTLVCLWFKARMKSCFLDTAVTNL